VSIESEATALAVMLCGTNSIASPRAMTLRVSASASPSSSVFGRERGAVARALVLASRIAGSGFFERASPLISRDIYSEHKPVLCSTVIDRGSVPLGCRVILRPSTLRGVVSLRGRQSVHGVLREFIRALTR
jgi:hypothetical protein